MKEPLCFLNGRYLSTRDAKVSALDRGLLFGEGLFESWRTYRGRPFALHEHLARMQRSARFLGIPFDADEPWDRRSRELARRNGAGDGASLIRLTVTRGAGPFELLPSQASKPTRLMLLRPVEDNLATARRDGVAIHIVTCGEGVDGDMRQLKTLNYLPAVIARSQARDRGCFEAVYSLKDGTILEGTTSNLFIVKRGRLLTTPVQAGVLPGVTRAIVLKLARRCADVQERRLTADDLANADEVFLTSSSIEIVPVTRTSRRRLAGGAVGELTCELQARYRRTVARRTGLPVDELGV